MNKALKNRQTAHERLRHFRDRIVLLSERKALIAEEIKATFNDADSEGFTRPALRKVVHRSMIDAVKRAKEQEIEEIADVYLANLGLLAGRPLDDAARRRADESRRKPPGEPPARADEAPGDDAPPADEGPADPAAAPPDAGLVPPQESNEDAHARGRSAADSGLSIFQNPYVAGDPRRAFWDEGWCEEVGSDGMEIPEAWRRKPSPKKPEEPQ